MGRTEYPAVPVTARGQATRRRLLDAAEEVFGAKGFERASIVDVTQSARVAQGPSTSTSRTSGRSSASWSASSVTTIGAFLGMRWVLWEERDPPAQVLDTMTALIHHGIAPPHEGSRRAGTDGQHRAGGHPGSPGR